MTHTTLYGNENNEFEYCKIKSIKELKTKRNCYDIQVENTHSYVGNNIVNHNTSIMAAWMKLTKLPTLIITDRATLGAQLAADFNEKGIDCGFCSGKGYKKGFCVVSTIQSIKKIQDLPRFKMVIHDEVHKGSSKSFQDFNASFGCPLKYGFSASPSNGDYLNFAKIRQHYGSIYIDVSADELIENEVMAKPKIHIVKTICPETMDYPSGYDMGIIHNDARNKSIKEITDKYDKGCAILVTSIEHGEILEKMIDNSKFISGSTPMEDRKAYIKMFNEGKLRVLIGSTILNEGISIPNIFALIQAGGQKSTTQTIQKIGRALRITKEKKEADFYDFWDMGNKFLLKHSKQRLGLYKKEGYKDFNVLNSDLEIEKDLTVK